MKELNNQMHEAISTIQREASPSENGINQDKISLSDDRKPMIIKKSFDEISNTVENAPIDELLMHFLGFKLGKSQIKPTDLDKNKILNLQIPKTKKEVKGLLGLFNF